MKVTYIDHSGFVAECEDIAMVFDYCRGELPAFGKEQKVFVFSSHAHHDHFNKSIFCLQNQYENVTYILSDDIRAKGPERHTMYVGPRQELMCGGMTIKTLRSTDEGVAFLVCTDRWTLFHAGDLNWWHWEEESDAYNERMRRLYQYEIGLIEGEKIDVAFLPLDPRQRTEYCLGMNYFMEHTDTQYVFPMHMWGEYGVYDRLMQEKGAVPYRERVKHITSANQVFDLNLQGEQ